jgi:hypothetical protein
LVKELEEQSRQLQKPRSDSISLSQISGLSSAGVPRDSDLVRELEEQSKLMVAKKVFIQQIQQNYGKL